MKKFRTAILTSMLTATAVMALAGAPTPAMAEYPDRPIRMIIPFPPGGATDILGRIVAKKLSELGGQPVVVETRQGAGGNVGMEAIARAKPDGYTIGMIITSHAINMSMPTKPSYDVKKDIAAIRILSTSNNILVVNPKVPATSVKELIALGRSGTMPLNFASSGNGTTPHFSGELFNKMAGINMKHVPYRGAGPAMVDVIGGSVEVMFDAITTAAPQIKDGKVRALAVTGVKRSPVFPDIPTIDEAGLPGYAIDGWLGVVAPAGIPPDAMAWLDKQIGVAMRSPEIEAKVAELGMVVSNLDSNASTLFIANEVAKWASIVKLIDAKND
ncbi:MAG: tripartite tricarboxylate transporter substrate binding protein [Burkholderiaceae bacterium]|nr:tripartite tricarboxylate transporter substrate binding protein [Burkholderiaceae bacterium]